MIVGKAIYEMSEFEFLEKLEKEMKLQKIKEANNLFWMIKRRRKYLK